MALGLGVGLPYFGSKGGVADAADGGYSAEALALFARFSTPPNDARKTAINDCIKELKNSGVWSKLKCLQVYAAADSQAAALNWVADTANATLVNSPTLTADKWIAGNGSNSYINTGANPTSLGVSQDSCTVGLWMAHPFGTDANVMAAWDAGFTHMTLMYALTGTAETPTVSLQINRTGSAWSPTLSNKACLGLVTGTRTSSSTLQLHHRGSLDSSVSSGHASTGVPNQPLYVGARNNAGSANGFNTKAHSAFFIAEALSDAENLALSDALDEYMEAVGNYRTPIVLWGDSQSTPGHYLTGMWRRSQTAGYPCRRGTVQGVSGENAAQIATRMVAGSQYAGQIELIWAGRNDISNGSQTVNTASILSNVATMVAAAQARGSEYVVLPPCKANLPVGHASITNSEATGTTIGIALDALKSTLSSTYGSNYWDVEAYMIAWATDAQALTIAGVSPTADDINDATAGVTPRSLLADAIHKAPATGDYVIGWGLVEYLEGRGI